MDWPFGQRDSGPGGYRWAILGVFGVIGAMVADGEAIERTKERLASSTQVDSAVKLVALV